MRKSQEDRRLERDLKNKLNQEILEMRRLGISVSADYVRNTMTSVRHAVRDSR